MISLEYLYAYFTSVNVKACAVSKHGEMFPQTTKISTTVLDSI